MPDRLMPRDHRASRARGGDASAARARGSARGWDGLLARGNRNLLRALAVRAKSRVVPSSDAREQEADEIASRVVTGRTMGANAPRDGRAGIAQRGAEDRAAASDTTPAPLRDALGSGHVLDGETRAFIEPRLGAPFGDVRVHDDARAAEAADALDARAFTAGRDVVFAAGEYDPRGAAGRELLAHELVHVLQQRVGAVARPAVQRQEEHHGTDADPADAGTANAGTDDAGWFPDYVTLGRAAAGTTSADTTAIDGGDDAFSPYAEVARQFDPCAVDVPSLDNEALLVRWSAARYYIRTKDAAHQHGEQKYWAYANLARRVGEERDRRARQGHAWLNEDVYDVPLTLYRIEAGLIPSTLVINRADRNAEAANSPTNGALVVTPAQFDKMLQRLGIPRMSPEEFFARQTAATAGPMVLPVPPQPLTQETSAVSTTANLLALGGPGPLVSPIASPLGLTTPPPVGADFGLVRRVLPPSGRTMYNWETFVDPVVTAGPYVFTPKQVGGFRVNWRGAMGEALYGSATIMPGSTMPRVIDLNDVQANAPLYDFLDPTTGVLTQLKTQLPRTPGGKPSLSAGQEALRAIFGQGKPQLRAEALGLQRTLVDPNLTLEGMILNTRVAVNPETVTPLQDWLVGAIKRNPVYYEPILKALMQKQPIQVQQKGNSGAVMTYNDFTTLRADYTAGKISEARYRAAIVDLAERARGQILSSGIGAETHLRPLLDFRQRFDFRGASDFAGFPDTTAGRTAATTLQREYFERIAMPELMDAQLYGVPSTLAKPAGLGAGLGLATSAMLGLAPMAETWDTDPYAGRRYLLNVGVGGVGGGISAGGDQLVRMGISQGGLITAEMLAQRGMSVAPVSMLAPTARFAGSTAWGGVSSGAITLGGMYLQESLLGTDFGPSDYWSKTARATAAGTVGGAGSALATAITAAVIGGEGGGGACTFVVPGVGTVACGTVGAVVGFGAGLVAYYVFDTTFGEDIEGSVRESMERGCPGR